MIQESSSLQSKKSATKQFIREEDGVAVEFLGKYSLLVMKNILQSMREGNKIDVSWNKDEKKVNKESGHENSQRRGQRDNDYPRGF
jgi:hypothetical protein